MRCLGGRGDSALPFRPLSRAQLLPDAVAEAGLEGASHAVQSIGRLPPAGVSCGAVRPELCHVPALREPTAHPQTLTLVQRCLRPLGRAHRRVRPAWPELLPRPPTHFRTRE